MDITLPEVQPHTQAAKFFRVGNRHMVEISLVGSKDTTVEKVGPDHMARFRAEWDAYCDGRPAERRTGIPLTDLPTIDAGRADHYVQRNVHTLEELAALNDGQCQGLGHGTLTDRQNAKKLIALRQSEQRDRLERELREKQASVGSSIDAEAQGEIDALKSDVAELKQGMGQILELLQKRKGGRPKKEKVE